MPPVDLQIVLYYYYDRHRTTYGTVLLLWPLYNYKLYCIIIMAAVELQIVLYYYYGRCRTTNCTVLLL